MKKFSLIIILSLLLISLFTFSASAITDTTFSKEFEEFVDGRSWGTDEDKLYYFSLFFYFIVFLAIYCEGLRFLPIFGGRRRVNTTGAWFAFAAAGLTTVSLFLVQATTFRTPTEIAIAAVSPFGIYGSFALAAINAWFVFFFIRHSKVFKDNILTAIAFALAIALTTYGAISQNILQEGLGYILVVLILAVIGVMYLIKHNSASTPGIPTTPEAEEAAEEGEKVEKYGMVEYTWLKKIKKELEAADPNDLCTGDPDDLDDKLTDLIRKERKTPYRLAKEVKRLEDALTALKSTTPPPTPPNMAKINDADKKLDIYDDSLIKIMGKDKGEFDKLLKATCASLGISGESKKQALTHYLDEAIKADMALIAIAKEIAEIDK
tara:strand:- start:9251 stop:10387 length:1137 start_codon:yes stop_codon:yes gene_type:complete